MGPVGPWGLWGPWGPLRQVMYRRRDAEWDSAPRCDRGDRGGPWGTVEDRGDRGNSVIFNGDLMVIFNGDF